MRKVFVFLLGATAYVASLNLTAWIADQGFGWWSVSTLAGLMVGTTYTVDRMV